MQIKYRITLVFSLIVTILLLVFCGAMYLFSYEDRVESFKERLINKSTSTLELAKSSAFTPDIIKIINRSSPSSLYNKSINVYDYANNKTFTYNDSNAKPIHITDKILTNVSVDRPYFFTIDERDAVAIADKSDGHDFIIITASYDGERVEWLAKLRLILIIVLLTGIIIVIFAGYIFSLGLIKALSEFTHKIKHISSEKFSLRLETGKGKDELQKLAITINDLLDRLQASFNLQRRFIDNASHELSTPLASIASQMDVALLKERSSDEYKKALLSINDDVRRLSMLVRSLLEIAKVSGSMGGTELTSVRIDELLMRIPPDLKKISPMYDVTIKFEEFPEQESSLIIYGNEHLLLSAIKNIVHNACKFSEDKKAHIVMSFTQTEIVIHITDNGPGIDDNDLKNIFQPFYRSSRHQSYVSGAGLGLSLAHRILGLHKGHIQVESELGKGTHFIITLPFESTVAQETAPGKSSKAGK